MFLKLYVFKDPRDKKTEQVYQYPECLASPMLRMSSCTLVTRQLLIPPILVVPDEYLCEMGTQGIITDPIYASFEYLTYKTEEAMKQGKQHHLDSKVAQLQSIFSNGTLHKRSCKSMFFTGPKAVYKKDFADKWVWKDPGVLSLTDRGHFATIESLSLKGINEVFITGTFVCGEESMKNTQCKISVSQT